MSEQEQPLTNADRLDEILSLANSIYFEYEHMRVGGMTADEREAWSRINDAAGKIACLACVSERTVPEANQ